jgi:hypothetical protein
VKALWTQVVSPPFLYLFPFAEAITTGFAGLELVTIGACPKSARGATARVNPPATLDCTKRRLFMPDQTTGRAALAMRGFERDVHGLKAVGKVSAYTDYSNYKNATYENP